MANPNRRVDLDTVRTLARASAIRQARIRPYGEGYRLEVDYGDVTAIVEKAHGGLRVFRRIDTPAKFLLKQGVGDIRVVPDGYNHNDQAELL